VDGTEVCIFKDAGEITLSSFLECEQSLRLKAELAVNAITYGSDKALKRSFG
jgi:hypothetical protein